MPDQEKKNRIRPGNNQPDAPAVPLLAFTISQAAQALQVSRVSIYRLRQRGLLHFNSSLRSPRIARSELERFLTETAK